MISNEELDRENREVVQQAWDELNPYNEIAPTYPKSIIDLLDDFFETCVEKYPDIFLMKGNELGTLTRCRRGSFKMETDVFPPSLELAESKNIVNRWNPPGRRYLYMAHSLNNPFVTERTENEYTCFHEMRAKKGEEYTFADFEVISGSGDKGFLNMDYTGLEQSDIETYYDNVICDEAQTIANAMIETGVFLTEEQLRPIAEKGTQKLAAGYVGKSFFRVICQTIFTPIDDDKCPDGVEREKAYKSFHILAEYLEKKNIAGVIYPSTRTALLGMHSQNAVAFHVEDFAVVPQSLRTLVF